MNFWKRWFTSRPKPADPLGRGIAALAAGDDAPGEHAARDLLASVADADPANGEAQLALGMLRLAEFQRAAAPAVLGEAVTLLSRAVALLPASPEAHFYLALGESFALDTIDAAEAHLATGHDVILGQYLARTEFVEQLEQLSRRLGSQFFEFVLVVDQPTLRARLEHRVAHPHRPEHEVNARLVSVSDVPALVSSTDRLLAQRPSAWPVDASGTPPETVDLVRERLAGPA